MQLYVLSSEQKYYSYVYPIPMNKHYSERVGADRAFSHQRSEALCLENDSGVLADPVEV